MKFIITFCSKLPFVSLTFLRYLKYFLNFIPWAAIFALFVWSYIIFIIQWVIPDLMTGHLKRGFFFGFVYHLLGILCFISYYRSALERPPKIELSPREEEEFEQIKSLLTRIELESTPTTQYTLPRHLIPKYCKRCQYYKPNRTHHCSWCERCIIKMDHHCPWIGNCVGGHNYKYFVLMLFYTMTFTAFVSISLFASVNNIRHHRKADMSAVFTVAAVGLALALGTGMLFSFHLYLLLTNSTTLECGLRVADCGNCRLGPNQYDQGTRNNLKSVFGDDPLFWLLPFKGGQKKMIEENIPLVSV